MATSSIRWTLAKHLIATINDAPAATGVLVEPGWPGAKHIKREMLWIDEITDTDASVPVMSGGRTHRDDMFTIAILARVAGRNTLDETMTRLEELGALIEDPIADSPTLDDFGSLVSADFAITAMTSGRTPEGPLGYARFEVRCHSRLT